MEYKKIGGEFDIDLSLIKVSPCGDFAADKNYLYSSGRSALCAILNSTKSQYPDIKSILLPEYLCESIIDAVKIADFDFSFYKLENGFDVCYDDLCAKLSDASCLLLINYFGCVDTEETIKKIRAIHDGQCVIVDNAQAFYEMQVHSSANYVFTSFRKWFSVPDGAWVKTSHTMSVDRGENNFFQFKFLGALLKHFSSDLKIDDAMYLSMFSLGEERLAHDYTAKCSDITRIIFNSIDFEDIAQARKINAEYISAQLEKMKISVVRGSKKPLVPFFVPIAIKDRAEIRAALAKKNIFLPVHWPRPEKAVCENSLYSSELSVIIDQRYSLDDMKIIIGALHDLRIAER